MVDWWLCWHSVESERYALWYPYNHVYTYSSYTTPCRTGTGGWARRTQSRSFIGPQFMTICIEFKGSSQFGLPWEELQKAGYESAVCAVLWDAKLPIQVGEFVHLWRRKEGGEGLELRIRYWLGHQVHLDLGLVKMPLDRAGGITGIKKRLASEKVAYEQSLHDQIGFTNLASILPNLYHEFGGKAKANL